MTQQLVVPAVQEWCARGDCEARFSKPLPRSRATGGGARRIGQPAHKNKRAWVIPPVVEAGMITRPLRRIGIRRRPMEGRRERTFIPRKGSSAHGRASRPLLFSDAMRSWRACPRPNGKRSWLSSPQPRRRRSRRPSPESTGRRRSERDTAPKQHKAPPSLHFGRSGGASKSCDARGFSPLDDNILLLLQPRTGRK